MTHDCDTITPLVPEGKTYTELSVRELSLISTQIGADVAAALRDTDTGAGKGWDALPRIAWCWAKRSDPAAKLDPFFDLEAAELQCLLGQHRDAELAAAGDEVDPAANPTAPAPAS